MEYHGIVVLGMHLHCAAMDAEFLNRIIIHDKTLDLHVVDRQPHPDPNYAPHSARPFVSRTTTCTDLQGPARDKGAAR